ncbi:MAG: arylsulfatase [Acidimicrobiales bacterium]|nr:arylsulfatase [Acidimicrobiales bacterium]
MADAQRPNVLVMMMDDLAYGDLACHGNPYVKTPVLDALHADSVRFPRYVSGPMCTPARASLMTGRYHLRTRAIDTFCGRSMIDPGEVTLGHVLQAAGYRTGAFGKWHLGDAYPMRACDLGFEETLMHNAGGIGQPGDHRENHWREGEAYFDPVLHRAGRAEKVSGYCTDVFADETIAFIEAHRDEPFFAYFATNAPHTPLEVPEQWIEPYRGGDLGETHARLYGMVANIDWNIGRILGALDDLGLADNTIVIYTSDHGPCASSRDYTLPADKQQRFNAGLRGEKGSLYDGAIKVPSFWRWPAGGVGGGRDVTAVASPIDVLPTVASATGASLRDDVHVDGVDLLPTLQGGPAPLPRRIYLQWHRGNTPERYRNYAVVTMQHKLYRPEPGKLDELYDLAADPGETNNLAAALPELVADLRAAYDAWFDDISATRADPFAAPRIVLGAAGEPHVVLTRQDWRVDDSLADMGELAGWMGTTAGWWEVTVERPVTARVEVRLDAFAWSRPDIHGTINLRVGDSTLTQPWVLQCTKYEFTVALPVGDTTIEAWADGGPTGRRSALYVDLITQEPV